MQAVKEFKGNICEFVVNMTLYLDTLHFDYYSETDPSHLYNAVFSFTPSRTNCQKASRQIQSIFRSLKRFYEYVEEYSQDKQRVEICAAGFVTISYFKQMTKPKKNLSIVQFDGRRLISKSEAQKQKQNQYDVIDVRAQNAFLRETFARLLKKHEENTKQLAEVRCQILAKQAQFLEELRMDSQELQKYEKEQQQREYIRQMDNQMQALRLEISGLMETVQIMAHEKPVFTEPPIEIEIDEDLELYGDQFWVEIDTNNRYIAQHFSINNNTLQKIGNYASFQVLGRDPMPNRGKHHYRVFVDHISYSVFSLGFVCQSRRNFANSHMERECIALFAKDGTIWQEGKCIGGGPTIPNGVEIRVVVDFDKEMVRFYQLTMETSKEIGAAPLNKYLIGKRIVPYIQINYSNNRVTFNVPSRDFPFPTR